MPDDQSSDADLRTVMAELQQRLSTHLKDAGPAVFPPGALPAGIGVEITSHEAGNYDPKADQALVTGVVRIRVYRETTA